MSELTFVLNIFFFTEKDNNLEMKEPSSVSQRKHVVHILNIMCYLNALNDSVTECL